MSETSRPVLLSIDGPIAEITLNRPDSLNAVNVEMAVALRDVVAELGERKDVRVVLLQGAGRVFMAGGDLNYFRAAEDKRAASDALIQPIHDAVAALSALPQIVVASLHGAVAGAGMSLAMIADLAVAEQGTVFNMAYAKVGNSPDCSGSWSLPRIVGLRKALEIALLSDDLSAEEALRLDLINRVADKGNGGLVAREMAERIAAMSPAAMANIKSLMRRSLDTSLEDQLDAEAKAFADTACTRDFSEALDAFFERRKPEFTGS
ncbi:enoyl-CoA hydratase [Spongiibacter sp. KMU-166]|uniref:Enoyl-CoA hydratase n=1 Tax=Spongiibacter thalassae TaxID=2721624 RepID=A0ABX1GD38_9GAMM|nr:enoyl-CoA hydratase-related protein [Spongiibacter thalassae]NKI16398.1 enoyl-CoA hydratase [Spongiibacter thalassae]